MLRPAMVRIIWCLLAAAAGALVVLGWSGVAERGPYGELYAAISLAVSVVFAATSALLVWRRPSDQVAVLGSFALLLFGAVTFPDFADQAAIRLAVLSGPTV